MQYRDNASSKASPLLSNIDDLARLVSAKITFLFSVGEPIHDLLGIL